MKVPMTEDRALELAEAALHQERVSPAALSASDADEAARIIAQIRIRKPERLRPAALAVWGDDFM